MLLGAFAIWIGYWVSVLLVYPAEEMASSRGLFGDMFGGVNALFTAFAFAGLLYTIVLQRDEIGLQLQEQRDTRAEFELQTRTFQRQQFENTFFSLLTAHSELIRQFDRSDDSYTRAGVDALAQTGLVIFDYVHPLYPNPRHPDGVDAIGIYEDMYPNYEQILGPYFRSLYHLLKYVDTTESAVLTDESRRLFAAIVRARLSSAELRLLFYNSLSSHGTKMKRLVEKYGLLKHIPESKVFHPDHRLLFSPTAFGGVTTRPREGGTAPQVV